MYTSCWFCSGTSLYLVKQLCPLTTRTTHFFWLIFQSILIGSTCVFVDNFSSKCHWLTPDYIILFPSLTVPNLLPNEDEIDHSSLYRWSFLVILAMTMTMTMDSNSVLHMRVTSAGQYESFEHVQNVCVPSENNLHSCLCALRTCSYRVCRTAYMLYSSHSHCVLVVLTVY